LFCSFDVLAARNFVGINGSGARRRALWIKGEESSELAAEEEEENAVEAVDEA
jgi:hypothetical protein